MNLWTAIVVIAAILAVTEVWKAKLRARHGITTDIVGNEKPMVPDEVKREVEELRERIKVLERIATEGGETKRLADEIDKLRDN